MANLIEAHDLRLVLLALTVCGLASATAFSVLSRSRQSDGRHRLAWLTAGAFVAGSGVWATHFVAMLAYRPGVPIGFDVPVTIASVTVSILVTWLGFAITLYRPRLVIVGGMVVSSAIGAMHYLGMAAMHAPASIHYNTTYVVASLTLGCLLGTGAVAAWAHRKKTRYAALAAILYVLAIAGLHFTGMAAATFEHSHTIVGASTVESPGWLAITIAAITALIMVLGLVGSIVDRHLAHRAASENARLRKHVDELQKMAATLKGALNDAAGASRAKSDFIAAMSHELRTPLNAILGFSEMMASQPLGKFGDPQYLEYVELIHQSGKQLLQIIEDVLDISKLEYNRLRLNLEPLDIATLGHDTARTMQALAEQKEVLLTCHIEGDLPQITADKRRIGQVLRNLVSNAVKFTAPGGKISVVIRQSEGDIALSVIDNGIGIAPEHLAFIFDRFAQVEQGRSRRYEGMGIGLPLAKGIVEQHGGSLKIESAGLDCGTTATITFPKEMFAAPNAEHGQPKRQAARAA